VRPASGAGLGAERRHARSGPPPTVAPKTTGLNAPGRRDQGDPNRFGQEWCSGRRTAYPAAFVGVIQLSQADNLAGGRR
jgi:hypothetical protein